MKGFAHKFVMGIIAVLALVSVASTIYIFRFQSVRGLDLEIEVPEEVLSGEPFDVQINFSNNSGSVLEDVVLTLVIPDGVSFFGSDPQKLIDNTSLGNIGDGSVVRESYRLVVFAPPDTLKELHASVSYSPSSLGASFEKRESSSIVVKSSGIEVGVTVPDNVVSGQDFPIEISYTNVSEYDFTNLELRIEYPPTFAFSGAVREPDRNNNVWLLGDLRSGSEGTFSFEGNMIGGSGSEAEFIVFLTMRAAGQEYLLARESVPIHVASSPLALEVMLNRDQDFAAQPGDTLHYVVRYENTTKSAISNIEIRAQLVGEMFDVASVQSQGLVRIADNTILWNAARVPGLVSLVPGDSGTLEFFVRVKDAYPVKSFSDKNFVLRVNAEAESPTVIDGRSRVVSKSVREVRVRGRLEVDSNVYFRDAQSGILNRGTMPPRVGMPTQFTIHWILKNYATDISSIEVSAQLGNNVKMVGEPRSSVGTIPSYNADTHEVVWIIDRMQANQGVIGSPISSVFQIEAIPAEDDAGNYMMLLSDTGVRAFDEFIGAEVFGSDGAKTTELTDDPTTHPQDGVVQP